MGKSQQDLDAMLLDSVQRQLAQMDAMAIWATDLPHRVPDGVMKALFPRLSLNASNFVWSIIHLCDSPIEELLLLWIGVVVSAQYGERRFESTAPDPLALNFRDTALHVEPQKRVLGYRVDFLVSEYSSDLIDGPHGVVGVAALRGQVVIECDGHNFHDRTKEQASRDRKRDRDLAAAGYRVLRFTGSDIWAHGCRCADEVLDHVSSVRESSPPYDRRLFDESR